LLALGLVALVDTEQLLAPASFGPDDRNLVIEIGRKADRAFQVVDALEPYVGGEPYDGVVVCGM
jgi:hypothetical protein